ncbi:MAG: hypothetical protein IJU70_03885 [Lentisphaeria bacterium]|nr:hypothetical protein [Lentisphaeria bacterium]
MDPRKKRFALQMAAVVLFLICSGCAAAKNAQESSAVRPVRTGFYVDKGSRSSGVLFWARLLAYSPQLKLVLVDAEDIRQNKLDELDLLVVPGGSSNLQCRTLGPEGMEKVRDFVAKGGSYTGACAGFHCALDKPDRLRLLPFEYRPGAGGATAMLRVEISEKGARIMGINPGVRWARYSHGPICRPKSGPDGSRGEVLGVYKSTIPRSNNQGGDFYGAPAVIFGQFGKGKVIAASFHPESRESTHDIALGCIYAVTGVRPVPVYPLKKARPLRVGFCSPGIVGKYGVNSMLALDRQSDLDVNFVDNQALCTDALRHLDVLVVPHGAETAYKGMFTAEFLRARLIEFMDRGGTILASGNGALHLPAHARMHALPPDADFVEALSALR